MLSSIHRTGRHLSQKPWLVFIFFLFLVICLRWSSFYQSVISWDESLYLLVAKAWSQGHPPYTTIWDNKPPGIYAIFLIAMTGLGHSVLSIRLIACLFIATTCFFLFRIGSLIKPNGVGIGLLAGVFYAISTLDNGGLAANTEIFYPFFVVLAAYLFFAHPPDAQVSPFKYHLTLLIIGFLLGVGFEIKYVVLFDFLAFCLILIFRSILQPRSNNNYWLTAQRAFFLTLGFVLPFVIVSAYFWLNGHFDDYIYANLTANKLRTVNLTFSLIPLWQAIVYQIQTNTFFWLSIPAAMTYLLMAKPQSPSERWIGFSFILWFFVNLLGICAVFRGYLYVHYFLQLSAGLSFITAYLLIRLIFPITTISEKFKLRQYLILAALLIALLDNTVVFSTLRSNMRYAYFTHIKGVKHWQDTPAMIAEYLNSKVKANDYIYVVDNAPIVYFLTNARIPTRYAFPSFLLLRPDLPNITSVKPLEELDRILLKQPLYIIKPNNYTDLAQVQDLAQTDGNRNFINQLNQALNATYQKETSIQEFDLYRLKPQP